MIEIHGPGARLGLIAATGCSGLAVLYRFPPSQYQIYPRCPFYAATHLLCPGCGGTRAIYELLHLNLTGALHYFWLRWRWSGSPGAVIVFIATTVFRRCPGRAASLSAWGL
jgi:hypothetical protein